MKPSADNFTRLIMKAIRQRLASRRTARLALLAGLSLVFVGCVTMPDTQEAIKDNMHSAWALYMEAKDQLEYTQKRDAFNGLGVK